MAARHIHPVSNTLSLVLFGALIIQHLVEITKDIAFYLISVSKHMNGSGMNDT